MSAAFFSQKGKLFIRNFWSDVFLSEKRRRHGELKRSHQKKRSEKGRRRENESPEPKLPRATRFTPEGFF